MSNQDRPNTTKSDRERLRTTHINYLLFRYLQEQGFESTAKTFVKDWELPNKLSNPEELPFAPVVQPGALTQLMLDGLAYDEMRGKCLFTSGPKAGQPRGRRHLISTPEAQIPGRLPPHPAAAQIREKDEALYRREQAAASRARLEIAQTPVVTSASNLSSDTVMSQLSKKIKKPNDHQQSNGARADDASGHTETGDTEMAEAETPTTEDAGPSKAEQTVETYDAENAATQTISRQPQRKIETLAWSVDGPQEVVSYASWNPDPSPSKVNTLLTAGEALCKVQTLHDAVNPKDDGTFIKEIRSIADDFLAIDRDVSAVAWHPSGEYFTVASHANESLQHIHSQLHDVRPGESPHRLYMRNSDARLDPPGVITHMAYSTDGEYLSTVKRVSNSGSKVVIFQAGTEIAEQSSYPVCGRSFFFHHVLGMAWSVSGALFVCGTNGLIRLIKIDLSTESSTLVDGTIEGMQDFSLRDDPKNGEPVLDFNHISCDKRTGIVACTGFKSVAEDQKKSVLALLAVDTEAVAKTQDLPFDVKLDFTDQITALAINQPRSEASAGAGTHSLVAVSLLAGRCVILDIERGNGSADPPVKYSSTEVELSFGQALAAAWSPDGRYLALGGSMQVLVFDLQIFPAAGEKAQPIANWEPSPIPIKGTDGNADFISTMFSDTNSADSGFEDGTNADEETGMDSVVEPQLTWSADGKWLAYAGQKMIAAIRFDPPLEMDVEVAQIDDRGGSADAEGEVL
ncbi:hypothetical protein MBLNU230_g8313t1 [Neophaeotheca triangularis]